MAGLPKHSFAWANRLDFGKWEMAWQLRSDLGHDLAHLRRGELDPSINIFTDFPGVRNFLSTSLDLPIDNGFPVFSDFYVESASYLSFDYLSASYAVSNRLKLSPSIQNLLLLTNYTGVDPSPRFSDRGPERNGVQPVLEPENGQLVADVDRRYFYPRSRAYTLAIRFSL